MMNPSGSPRAQEPIPDYMVNVSINNVDQAWEEWDKGLVNGPEGMRSPSIRYLEGTSALNGEGEMPPDKDTGVVKR